MRGATMFSGIAAPEVALPEVQWLWCAEIDKFACRLLTHRHPQIPNLGDVTAEDFSERARAYGAIDILVAGAPCQDFSVAGRRAGMAGARGSLSLRFIELVGELRPARLLFENVPGLVSSVSHVAPDSSPPPDDLQPGEERVIEDDYEADEGSDFGYFLAALSDIGYSSFAWTVLDAQYFHLAQRRERVFVVASLGDWRDPFSVLFDAQSLSGNPAPCREARQDVTGTISARTSAGGGLGTDFEIGGGLSRALRGRPNASHREDSDTYVPVTSMCLNGGGLNRIDAESETFVTHALRADGFDAGEDGTGRGTPLVAQTITADMYRSGGATAGFNPGVRNVIPVLAFSCKDHGADAGELVPTLRAMEHDGSHANAGGQVAVAFQEAQTGVREYDTAGTLRADGPGHDPVGTRVRSGMAVRRLTPLECERLQGFPEGYTAIPNAADGPRYRALGNSMAVPVIRWLLRRILEAAC